MTPKEALRRISGFISFCCYEYFDKELEKDWKKDIDAITQALNRLEGIDKVWHENEPMESVDINGKHLQEKYDFINKLIDENEKLEKVIKILKDKVTFRWRNDDILEIVKYIWQNNSPRIEILTNYEEDELLKEFLE